MLEQPAEVFRSAYRADCAERAFMLSAVGIASAITIDDFQSVLLVEAARLGAASEHLRAYELERQPLAAPPPPPRPWPHAWLGCLGYALVLILVALSVGNGWWRLDALDLGELDGAAVQSGQWWRIFTALTLHADGEHLSANLAAGCWFGYLAARQIGVGHAWLLTVLGAGAANLLEGLAGPPSHVVIGASTAVFTTLGLLSAHAWRVRGRGVQRWALRWAPLVGGVGLLGWTGSGGGDAQVDVVAHVIGFAIGCGLGVLIAAPAAEPLLARLPQWPAGLAALAILAAAWSYALYR